MNPKFIAGLRVSAKTVSIILKTVLIAFSVFVLLSVFVMCDQMDFFDDSPRHNAKELWVSEGYPRMLFSWDEEVGEFRGVADCNGELMEYRINFSPQMPVFDIAFIKNDVIDTDKRIIFDAEYNKGVVTGRLYKNETEFFQDSDMSDITFLVHDKSDYLEEHGLLKFPE